MAMTCARSAGALRNIAVCGPPGSGKSTLVRALAGNTAAIQHWGQLDALTLRDQGVFVTLLDPRGGREHEGELRAALHAADSVAFVISATGGVDAATIELWHECAARRVPRCIVVTHLDDERADFDEIVAICQRVFPGAVVAVQYPVLDDDETLGGFIDIVTMQVHDLRASEPSVRSADPEHVTLLTPARQRIAEALLATSTDQHLIDAVIAEASIDPGVLAHELRKAVHLGEVAPIVVAGTSPHRFGIDALREVLRGYLPAPPELPRVVAVSPEGTAVSPLSADPTQPLSAQVIASSADRGELVRVFRGTLTPGPVTRLRGTNTTARTIATLHYPGVTHTVPEAIAGSIVVADGIGDARPGDTLAAASDPVLLEPWITPRPLYPVTVHGVSADALQTWAQRYVGVRVADDVLWCQGAEHAAALLASLRADVDPKASAQPARIALRETITQPVEVATGQSRLALEPLARGSGVTIDAPKGLSARIADQLRAGPIAGYPVTDLAVRLIDPSETTSDAMWCSKLDQAVRDGAPCLLEPIVDVTIRVAQDEVEAVTRDLERRRADVHNRSDEPNGTVLLNVLVPERETARYALELIGLSENATLEAITPAGFAPLPASLADRYS